MKNRKNVRVQYYPVETEVPQIEYLIKKLRYCLQFTRHYPTKKMVLDIH